MTYFSVTKEELVKAMAIGGQFAGKNRSMPISDSVKIESLKDKVRIYSTDGDNWIGKRCMVAEKSDDDYSFCVSYKSIMPYIKTCGPIITFRIDIDKGMLNIEHGNSKARFPIFITDSFPSVPNINEEHNSFSIKSTLIRDWICSSTDFVAHDELRPILNGMFVTLHDNKIEYCATDGHAMITECLDYDYDNKSASVIIRNNIFRAVSDMTLGTESTKISFDNNIMMIQSGNAVLFAKQVEGNYPNFNAVIPTEHKLKEVVNKKELMSAINRLNTINNTSDGLIKFDFSEDSLHINCVDMDVEVSGDEMLSCEGDGKCMIGFKGEKISNAMNIINTDDAIFYLIDQTKAAIILNSDGKSTLKILIMPMLIN